MLYWFAVLMIGSMVGYLLVLIAHVLRRLNGYLVVKKKHETLWCRWSEKQNLKELLLDGSINQQQYLELMQAIDAKWHVNGESV